MKYGLVLEGGGAKGSYQVGAMKALIENGFEFSCVTGTSIGAINAALIAQGDFDLLYEMWQTMSYDDLFDIDKQYINKLLKLYVGKDTIKYLTLQIKKAIKEKGIDTSKIRKLLNEKIDEEKLRKSDVDFGLVTYCLSDQRAQEIFLEDMPKGKIVDYIMASSNLPVFKRAKIDDKHYLDGGIYDNCPVHMLEKKGYKEVYVIRAFKKNRIRGYNAILKRAKTTIHMIEPVKELSHILDFRRDV
ncbi:MAG: patatin-like phospholipase family protein, partial [Clostridia bacterium]